MNYIVRLYTHPTHPSGYAYFLLHHVNDVKLDNILLSELILAHTRIYLWLSVSTSTYCNKNFFLYPTWTKICFSRIFISFSINPIISSKFLYLTILPLRKPNIILHIHIEKKIVCKHTLAKPKDKCRSIFVAKHYILGTTNFSGTLCNIFEYIKT